MGGLATFGFVAGTTVFVLATLGFAAGAVWRGTGTTRKFYAVMAMAAGALAIAYAGMAAGLGVRSPGAGIRSVYVLRYAGWLVGTPLVLLAMWWLAGSTRRTLAGLVGLDVLGVLAAWAAALTTPAVAGLSVRETRLALVGAAAVLFVGVVLVVFRVLSPHAGRQPSEVGILFSILRNVVGLVWILYAVVWVLGIGLRIVGPGVQTVAVFVLDLTAVVVVGGILLHDEETLAQAQPGQTILGRGVAEYRSKILAKIRG